MINSDIDLQAEDGTVHSCKISCTVIDCGVNFQADSVASGSFAVIQSDAFECLCRFREEIAKQGLVPLCVGARLDAFPSGMCRDMGKGFQVYITQIGSAANHPPVSIFEPAPYETVASVGDQKARYQHWISSFG